MPKSRIIKELVEDKITLSKALYRILLIADDLRDNELASWAEKEINGYNSDDEIPDYRSINQGGIIIYSGINGRFKIINQPLPEYYLPREYIADIKELNIQRGIEEIERLACSTEKRIMKDLTFLAPEVYKLSGGIQCTMIRVEFDIESIVSILSVVKTRVIKVLLKLEKEFGTLDDLDITLDQMATKNLDDLYKEIKIIIYDHSVKVGDGNKISNSDFKVGSDI